MRGSHIKLGEGERKVRLGQDSLPNKAEMSGGIEYVVLPAPLSLELMFSFFLLLFNLADR